MTTNTVHTTACTVVCTAMALFASSSVALQSDAATLWYSGDFDEKWGADNFIGPPQIVVSPIEVFERFDVTDTSGWNITAVWSDDYNLGFEYGAVITQADWSIRSGMGQNDGGTILFSGTSPLVVTPTGRGETFWNGSPSHTNLEYQLEVTGLNIHLSQGEYWLNVTPYVNPYTSQADISETVGLNAVGTPSGSADPGLLYVPGFENYETPGPGFSMGVAGDIAIPEPSSLLLAAVGALVLWPLLKRNRA